jgi:hypothetical protein
MYMAAAAGRGGPAAGPGGAPGAGVYLTDGGAQQPAMYYPPGGFAFYPAAQ